MIEVARAFLPPVIFCAVPVLLKLCGLITLPWHVVLVPTAMTLAVSAYIALNVLSVLTAVVLICMWIQHVRSRRDHDAY